MVKIINSALETLALLENVTSPMISEEINRAFTFDFSAVIDNNKSTYVNYQNKVEVEDNYFNIVKTIEQRTSDGIFVSANCEHVSYDLQRVTYTSGFTATGEFSAAMTTILTDVNTALGTGFTLGTITVTGNETLSVTESVTARELLLDLAALYSGELKYNKYEISLLKTRGADRGVVFRYRKNLIGASRTIDAQNLDDSGYPTISYECSAAELEFEKSFIARGHSTYEHYELGDTVRVLDPELNFDASLRIVKESHNPFQRGQGTVGIGNFIDDIFDTLTHIKTTTVTKNAIYNGCSIGPDRGFVATRSDDICETSLNATEGITIKLRDTATASYTSVFYVAMDTATGTATLYIKGNSVFDGTLSADVINALSVLITPNLYAGKATIAELTVDQLDTSTKVANYLASSTADVNYIKIYEQNLQFITASTGGSATETAQNRNGVDLYWTDTAYETASSAATTWPVTIYEYTEATKAQYSFVEASAISTATGTYIPSIILGAGSGVGDNDKMFIFKEEDKVTLKYIGGTGNETVMAFADKIDADLRRLESATIGTAEITVTMEGLTSTETLDYVEDSASMTFTWPDTFTTTISIS